MWHRDRNVSKCQWKKDGIRLAWSKAVTKLQLVKKKKNYLWSVINACIFCYCLVAQSCPTLATPWTVAHQAPLFMRFSRQEYGVGCYSLLQMIFPTRGSNLPLVHCPEGSLLLSHWGSPNACILLTFPTNQTGFDSIHGLPLRRNSSKRTRWELKGTGT